MNSIDRNEVDISTLFKWKKQVSIVDANGDIALTAYLRLVGDAELNRSRVYALRKSAELRKKLHDPESDEHIGFLPDIDIAEKENILEALLVQYTREFAQDAVQNVKLVLPTEPPSTANLEEQEKYQQEVDNWPQYREDKIREYMLDKLEAKRKELDKESKEKLFKEYIRLLTNRLCEEEMIKAYREMCVYFGLYKDELLKEKMFESYEVFDNLNSDIKNQLISAYLDLEVDGEELKKSPVVTQ